MATGSSGSTKRWSAARANQWYAGLPWPVGCNYIPSSAVNQLEMWQAESYDPEINRRELGRAADLGMNTVRVFLHDLLHESEGEAFLDRVDAFLAICAGHGIRVMLVLFDDCWHPGAAPGPQPPPIPGLHNSRWLQSPGVPAATDPAAEERLQRYVRDTVSRFAADSRVLVWDIYNENGNFFLPLLSQAFFARWSRLIPRFLKFRFSLPPTLPLLEKAFAWARAGQPEQPLTAGTWIDHPRLNQKLTELSDVVSFHNYEKPQKLRTQIEKLQKLGRPLLCTEYLGRSRGSVFESALPILREHRVAAYNWGLVSGKTQTIYSWEDRRPGEPELWYHDILHPDGSPYRASEVELMRRLTGRGRSEQPGR